MLQKSKTSKTTQKQDTVGENAVDEGRDSFQQVFLLWITRHISEERLNMKIILLTS